MWYMTSRNSISSNKPVFTSLVYTTRLSSERNTSATLCEFFTTTIISNKWIQLHISKYMIYIAPVLEELGCVNVCNVLYLLAHYLVITYNKYVFKQITISPGFRMATHLSFKQIQYLFYKILDAKISPYLIFHCPRIYLRCWCLKPSKWILSTYQQQNYS